MGKQEKPLAYSGETNEYGHADDPEAWIRRFELAARINEWDTDAAKSSRLGFYLTGEAAVWYDINHHWVEDPDTDWEDVKREFLRRFRPVNFDDELEDRLRAPRQDVGESVRSYGDRYQKLYAQARPGHLDRDFCRKYWIAGLDTSIKEDVLKAAPATFDEAITRAMALEQVRLQLRRDAEQQKMLRRPPPRVGRSADIAAANMIADKAAGYDAGEGKLSFPGLQDLSSRELQSFQDTLGSENTDELEIDDLISRIRAWQLYSRLISDPAKLKAKVLQAAPVRKRSTREESAPPRVRTQPNDSRPGHLASNECAFCRKSGHWKRDCPELREKKKVTTKVITSRKARASDVSSPPSSNSSSSSSEAEGSDSDREIVRAYQASAKKAKAMAGKRLPNEDTDMIVVEG